MAKKYGGQKVFFGLDNAYYGSLDYLASESRQTSTGFCPSKVVCTLRVLSLYLKGFKAEKYHAYIPSYYDEEYRECACDSWGTLGEGVSDSKANVEGRKL